MNYVHYKSRTINIKGEVLITEIYDDYFLKMMSGTLQLLTNSSNFKIVSRTIETKEKMFSFRIKSKNLNLEFKYLFETDS